MSSQVARHYARLISQWPKDPLRPTVNLADTLKARANKTTRSPFIDEARELKNIKALYSLLGNRYSQKYPTTEAFFKPKSSPKHYENLIQELDQAPKRTSFGSWLNKWKGFIRLS
ncbi:hypothetical protein M501DRAFT_1019411 [Patellaria atrata CBS 101060]|uniref:Uncharacterized protein n=1 Tax=Patellaria atrata CBS 101060 TaxID=1346257 RepID=A0A9P4S5Z4_9PEZI|nr:hypothetical protein M501DRAFT_1019411 [Patellaria atrata CBS 101060]